MKKENVIDLEAYCNKQNTTHSETSSISKELEHAIQLLIYRLRELGPIKKVNG